MSYNIWYLLFSRYIYLLDMGHRDSDKFSAQVHSATVTAAARHHARGPTQRATQPASMPRSLCDGCSQPGHRYKDQKCPVRNTSCNFCCAVGHFEKPLFFLTRWV